MIYQSNYTLSQAPSVAKKIIDLFSSYSIILFYGEVGSGKTTLINEISKQLQVEQDTSSPTFAIINEYDSKLGLIYHMDLYRLKSLDEALEIGIDEYIYSGDICLIEWPQVIEGLIFDEKCLAVEIEYLSESERNIKLSEITTED